MPVQGREGPEELQECPREENRLKNNEEEERDKRQKVKARNPCRPPKRTAGPLGERGERVHNLPRPPGILVQKWLFHGKPGKSVDGKQPEARTPWRCASGTAASLSKSEELQNRKPKGEQPKKNTQTGAWADRRGRGYKCGGGRDVAEAKIP